MAKAPKPFEDIRSILVKESRETYADISPAIRYFGKAISSYGIALYAVICAHTRDTKKSWQSLELLSDEIGASKQTVVTYLKKLARYNIIRIENRQDDTGGDTSNYYWLTPLKEWRHPDTPFDEDGNPLPFVPPEWESTTLTPTQNDGVHHVDTGTGESTTLTRGVNELGTGESTTLTQSPTTLSPTTSSPTKDTAAAAEGHSASASVGARGASARPKTSPPAEGAAAAAQAETMVVTTTASLPATSTPAPLAANALAATMQGGTTAQVIADAGESEGGPSLEEMLGWSDEDEGQAASPPTGTEAPPAAAGASPGARAETPDEHRQKYTESLDDATRETLRVMCAKLKGYKGFSNRVVIDLFEATGMDLMRQGADVLAATAEFCGTYGREGRGCTKGTPTAMLMGFWRRRTAAMFTPPARTGEKGGGRKGGERQYTPLAEAGVATNAVSMDARMAAWRQAQAGTGVSLPTP